MDWDYRQAFSRHVGIFSTEEQQQLKTARVAIAGLGGVGGVHLIAMPLNHVYGPPAWATFQTDSGEDAPFHLA